jgi:hypothetical protein
VHDEVIQFEGVLPDPLTEGGHHDYVRAEPVVEIVAEEFFRAQLVKGPVRRRDDPPGKAFFFVAPDRRVGAFLQDMEELYLDRDRDFADLVNEVRTLIILLPSPPLLCSRLPRPLVIGNGRSDPGAQ